MAISDKEFASIKIGDKVYRRHSWLTGGKYIKKKVKGQIWQTQLPGKFEHVVIEYKVVSKITNTIEGKNADTVVYFLAEQYCPKQKRVVRTDAIDKQYQGINWHVSKKDAENPILSAWITKTSRGDYLVQGSCFSTHIAKKSEALAWCKKNKLKVEPNKKVKANAK